MVKVIRVDDETKKKIRIITVMSGLTEPEAIKEMVDFYIEHSEEADIVEDVVSDK